jgi:hypothetical protein
MIRDANSNLKDLKENKEINEKNDARHPLSPLREPLHGRAKSDPKAKILYLQSFVRKGVWLGHAGRN